MPVKRRKAKRRVDPEAELEAWSGLFECGWDFFGEVADFTGLTEPVHVRPPEDRAEAERKWNDARAEAWKQLGATFMERWRAGQHKYNARDVPWAVEQFGEPPCR